MQTLQIALAVACALTALGLVVQIARDLAPGRSFVAVLGLIEAGLVCHLVLGVVKVSGGHADVSVATYVGYLVGALLILPAGVIWSQSERTRSGTAVLLVAVLLIPFLIVRVNQVWAAGNVGGHV